MDHLLARARRFDGAALTEIYEGLSPRLYRYAYRLLGEPCEAEDAVAEAFHRFLLALRNGGGPEAHVSAYLYRTVHNVITDRYRRRPVPDMPLDEALAAGEAADPAHAAAQHIAAAHARAALWRLTDDQRLVVMLKFFEGLDNEEVALALGKPAGAVKSLQHRALEALRRLLAGELAEGKARDEQLA
jgi:RNA polymerase sigma-70 factor (ECF subfamily)